MGVLPKTRRVGNVAFGLGMVATIFLARWFFRARAWVRQIGRGRPAA